MRSVTPTRVLPHWAIEELGQAAEAFDLKITVRPLHSVRPLYRDWPQMLIDVNYECGDFQFVVGMEEDWGDLSRLCEGDLWDIVRKRYEGLINE